VKVEMMEAPSCSLNNDVSFRPWAGSCRGRFDFTLLLEHNILILLLAALFLASLFYAWHLQQRDRKGVIRGGG
jgi:hypothetical protein